jgi:hypothetical protein
MDAGALGALIGVGVMVAIYIFYYFHDLYEKRKEKLMKKVSPETVPKIVVQNPMTEMTPILIKKPSHKKLNEFLPERSVPSPLSL